MNFEFFNHIYEKSECDEVKVIGKDVIQEGKAYHLLGMTRKNKEVTVYVLEWNETMDEEVDEDIEGIYREKTPRESMKENMREKNNSIFFHAIELKSGGMVYETASGASGRMNNNDYSETVLLFAKMYQAGWKLSEESLFYEIPWSSMFLTEITLREEYDKLPDFSKELSISYDFIPAECAIEQPIVLKPGMEAVIPFSMEDGRTAECYINRVTAMDVWKEQEERFADPVYRERMLQHVTEEELEDMKTQVLQILEESCPKGKYYYVVEYECTQDVSLRFFDKASLDTIPEPKAGSTSALFMSAKPDKELGSHGWKLRGCVIQTPMDTETEEMEAELFSYRERTTRKELQL